MPASEIQAVIFDCDGTLVDSEILSLQVLVDYVAEFDLLIHHEEAMAKFAGNELSVVFADIENRLGHSLPDGFLQEFRSRQIALLQEQVQPCPGADELLSSLSVPFCVASNAPLNKIDVCLQTTRLKRHFAEHEVFSAYEVQKWKPAPDVFLHAATAMNVEPRHCAVVEDSSFGIQAGLAAGMQVFVYDPRNHHTEVHDYCRTVNHLKDLMPFFP